MKRKVKPKRKIKVWIAVLAAVIVFCVIAFDERLQISEYEIKTDKVSSPVMVVQVSDLHNATYGKENERLFSAIDALKPDFVVLTGDIAVPETDKTPSIEFAEKLAKKYDCYYVIGNHENSYKGRYKKICAEFEAAGFTVLHGEGRTVKVRENEIFVCGIDDPLASPDYNENMWENQLANCAAAVKVENFSILLSHRPECVGYYRDTDFDLIFSGHAHGGQARIPLLLPQGIYAPNQGFFPKYTSGTFELKSGQTLVVSRGLSKYIRPRIFNRPEIVKVTIFPDK